jgi:predicted nucleotidyltransferase
VDRRGLLSCAEALGHAVRAAALLARDPRVVLVYVFGSAVAPDAQAHATSTSPC